MSEPIPKTMPRSTLACPPAKNFMDQLNKPSSQASQAQLSSKSSTAVFEKMSKKEAEKDTGVKPPSKENAPVKSDNFGSTGSHFRASSKDLKPQKAPVQKDPSSAKK